MKAQGDDEPTYGTIPKQVSFGYHFWSAAFYDTTRPIFLSLFHLVLSYFWEVQKSSMIPFLLDELPKHVSSTQKEKKFFVNLIRQRFWYGENYSTRKPKSNQKIQNQNQNIFDHHDQRRN